ncbi:MAG TPA: PEGA domain-containing protein [Polyangiaceae bacterium]|nr:PEGA domain-containing protein [Polyangiaceae bacterium]
MNDESPLAARGESPLAALLRWLTPYVAFLAAGVLALLFVLSLTSCEPAAERPAVSLSLARNAKSPPDAAVTIDEEYIGPLGYVSARGVKLPAGKHRITIEKPGYFPWDRLVEASTEPVHFDVILEPIPD